MKKMSNIQESLMLLVKGRVTLTSGNHLTLQVKVSLATNAPQEIN